MRYADGEYRVIPNGVEFERFAEPLPPPTHLDDNVPTVLFVGRIESRKGIPYLLKAFQRVKQRRPDTRLVIVGEGGLRRQYEHQSEKLGLRDVLFEGHVSAESLPAYYQRADVFASPSTVNESFGITLLEAMAARTPVVATSINGTNTLGEHGVTGLIVPPKNPPAMAEAIEQLLDDRAAAARYVEAAQDRARRFDWEQIALQLLDYYEELGA
jgi:phosphatidylinositol alpha-mannosyltransferase